jgi:hypothetical protein
MYPTYANGILRPVPHVGRGPRGSCEALHICTSLSFFVAGVGTRGWVSGAGAASAVICMNARCERDRKSQKPGAGGE